MQADGEDESLGHIVRCATGALINLQRIAEASEFAASLTPSASSRVDGEGGEGEEECSTSNATERGLAADTLDAKLQRAVLARLAHERHVAQKEAAAATRLQRQQRRRLAARASQPCVESSREPPYGAGARAREAARARMRAAADAAAAALMSDRTGLPGELSESAGAPSDKSGDASDLAGETASGLSGYVGRVQPAMLALARQLTDVVGAEDEVRALCSGYPVRPMRALCGCACCLVCLPAAAAEWLPR